MSVDRNSPLPLYYQLKRLLLDQISNGDLKAGDILPTEQQIQDTYNVSRTTVRQALSELEEEGKITRQRGRGTFVAQPKVSHGLEPYPSLADNMAVQGLTPGWRLLSAEWVAPVPEAANALQVDADQQVFCLERLRLENDRPLGYHVAYVAPEYASFVDENAFMTGGSLRYLRALAVLENSVADRTLEAVPAPEHVAEMLGTHAGAALLRIQRVVYTPEPEHKPVEFFRGLYRGDRFQYHINNMRAVSSINA